MLPSVLGSKFRRIALNTEQIITLFKKYLNQQATPEEIRELLRYFDLEDDQSTLRTLIHQELQQLDAQNEIPASVQEFVQHLDETLPAAIDEYESRKTIRKIPLLKYAAIAALFIIALAIALYFFRSDFIVNRKSKLVNQDILPGYNQATLTLANGKIISLDSAQSGIIVQDEDIKYQNGESVSGRHPGPISAKTSPKSGEMLNQVQHDALLQLSTPKGGQYQIILSDGTKVWLNAASTLKYPSRFSISKREVEINGEAFFEVAKVKDQPFIVKSRGQQVDVIGTSFNISSYENEESIITTLLEGSVKVSKGGHTEFIKPGQQSMATDKITINTADIDAAVAWKNGKTYFKDADIPTIMRTISRWYNVDVVYKGKIKKELFTGGISRSSNLSSLLKILQSGGIHSKIEDNKLIITP
ncbi:FecR family protein [bacterium A37T11]|nr:FecR family protein [bacterium A37T11]